VHSLSFELDAVPPFSFELTVHNPAGWHWYSPLEVLSGGRVWIALRLATGGVVGLRLESLGSVERPRVLLRVFCQRELAKAEAEEVLRRVEGLAGLREDVAGFYRAAEGDPVLRQAVGDLYGMRDRAIFRDSVFTSALLAVTFQNAPINRTAQMLRLLITGYGERLDFDGKTSYMWPTPSAVLSASPGELAERCRVGYRAGYIRSVAEAVSSGACPTLGELAQMPFHEAKAELVKLRGIGDYSAEVILPHPESFPVDKWSAEIFWELFFPGEEMPPGAQAIRLVRRHAEKRWGGWRRQAFTYVLCDRENLSKRLRAGPG